MEILFKFLSNNEGRTGITFAIIGMIICAVIMIFENINHGNNNKVLK